MVALFVIGGSVAAQAASSPAAVDGSGTLTVDGVVYPFTPTTCLITSDQFVVAGSGADGDERFWVAGSTTEIDLAIGTSTETAEPAEHQLWLVSDAAPSWRAADTVVTARTVMSDPRRNDATTLIGLLEFDCGPARPT